jgi:hypothetical protein
MSMFVQRINVKIYVMDRIKKIGCREVGIECINEIISEAELINMGYRPNRNHSDLNHF